MIKIKILTLGHMPANFDKRKIEKWKSNLFSITGNIENYRLRNNSDGADWEYTDQNLMEIITKDKDANFTIVVTNIPLEDNYYSRRIDDNLAVFTFYEMKEILENKNIPLENLLLRIIYAYSLVYIRFDNKIPKTLSTSSFTHDEVRGCLFDMTGIKTEVIYSCCSPKICSECIEKLSRERVSVDKINIAQSEIKKIKKELFYDLKDKFQKHPISSFILIVILSTIISEFLKLGFDLALKIFI